MRVAFLAIACIVAASAVPKALAEPMGSPPRPAAPAPPAAAPKDKPKENDDKSGRCCAALKSLGFSSNLPVFIIDTAGQVIPGGPPPGGGEPNFEAKKIEVTCVFGSCGLALTWSLYLYSSSSLFRTSFSSVTLCSSLVSAGPELLALSPLLTCSNPQALYLHASRGPRRGLPGQCGRINPRLHHQEAVHQKVLLD